MNSQRKAPDQVFILRFWQEDQGAGREFRWRAQIRNVNTRQRHIANDIEQAFALLQARLRVAALAAERCTDQ